MLAPGGRNSDYPGSHQAESMIPAGVRREDLGSADHPGSHRAGSMFHFSNDSWLAMLSGDRRRSTTSGAR